MGEDSITKFIGLDVHSKTISVAIADEGRKGEGQDISAESLTSSIYIIHPFLFNTNCLS